MLVIEKQYPEHFLMTLAQLCQQEFPHTGWIAEHLIPLQFFPQVTPRQLHHRLQLDKLGLTQSTGTTKCGLVGGQQLTKIAKLMQQ